MASAVLPVTGRADRIDRSSRPAGAHDGNIDNVRSIDARQNSCSALW
jgi:hypothetical protein